MAMYPASRLGSERHTLSVLVENRPGVLARIAGLFARRAFNINSLSVSPTERPDISRVTVTADVEAVPLEQIIKQLNKLLHVLKIVELDPNTTVERELVLIKVAANESNRSVGPCAGGAVYSPALTDFIIMKKGSSNMFLTGPKVVKTVTGEDVTQEQLGGATMHTTKSGVAQFAVETEEEGIQLIRQLLSYMPQNNMEDTPMVVCTDQINRLEDSLNEIIPDNPNKPYDMAEVIRAIVDNGEYLESAADFAKNIITCFARFNGQSVGIIANQPKYMAGVLDINASRKAARFVRFCDAFNIPLVTLVDVPGFLPGTTQEYGGVITHGAKLLFAYCEATVPKITVTLRKAYGGAYIVMSSKHIRGDINYAWPTAEIAVMGASGAVEVLHAKELAAFESAEEKAKFVAEKEQEYRDKFSNPYNAARYGYIDDVIEPRNTRFRIIRALQSLATKRLQNPAKKHSNIPL